MSLVSIRRFGVLSAATVLSLLVLGTSLGKLVFVATHPFFLPLKDHLLTRHFLLWSQQVMSTILKHLTAGLPQLNLDGKSKTPTVAFGEAEQEHVIVFREGELLQV